MGIYLSQIWESLIEFGRPAFSWKSNQNTSLGITYRHTEMYKTCVGFYGVWVMKVAYTQFPKQNSNYFIEYLWTILCNTQLLF